MPGLVVIASLLLLAGIGIGCGDSETSPPAASDHVVVPKVVGLPRSRATCVLVNAGLRWRGGGEPKANTRPAGPCPDEGAAGAPDPRIKEQSPRAGRQVPEGTVVVLEDACTLLRFDARDRGCQ